MDRRQKKTVLFSHEDILSTKTSHILNKENISKSQLYASLLFSDNSLLYLES